MVDFIELIRKHILPSIENKNEVCFAFEDSKGIFEDVTIQATNRMCVPSKGRRIMAHTHPLRHKSHPIGSNETNYYPSCQDLLLPLIQPIVEYNIIVTPIGVYIASFTHTKDNKLDENQIYMLLCGGNNNSSELSGIDEVFFPIHNFLKDICPPGTSFEDISNNITKPIITYINNSCYTIQEFINNTIQSWGFPKKYKYNIQYIDIYTLLNKRKIKSSIGFRKNSKKKKVKRKQSKKK